MKVNTIPVTFSHQHSFCSRFLNGFFDYSGRQWVVMQAKGKDLHVLEIRDPHFRSANALKIILLFTAVVPLIAAIYHCIKLSQFKHFCVSFYKKDEPLLQSTPQIRSLKEEQALIFVPKEPFTIEPLKAEAAYTYLLTHELEWNSENQVILQNLEKIPFKYIWKWNLQNLEEFFIHLKEIEIAYEEILPETLSLISSLKGNFTLSFTGAGFKESQETFLLQHLEMLTFLFNHSPEAHFYLLISSLKYEQAKDLFTNLLTNEAISKLSQENKVLFLRHLGRHLENREVPPSYLSKVDLFPYIFKSEIDFTVLLRSLIRLTQDKACQNIKKMSVLHPELVESLFGKVRQCQEKDPSCQAYKQALVAYISSPNVFKDPDSALKLLMEERATVHVNQLLSVFDPLEKKFYENIKELLFHNDTKVVTKLQFINRYYASDIVIPHIRELFTTRFEEFHNACLDKTSDEIFDPYDEWNHTLREWRAYILLIKCFSYSSETQLIDHSEFLLKKRPVDFSAAQLRNIYTDTSAYNLVLAFEFLHALDQKNIVQLQKSLTLSKINLGEVAKNLGLITPSSQFGEVLVLYNNYPEYSRHFVESILKHRDNGSLKNILRALFTNFLKYFLNFARIRALLSCFRTQEKLGVALEGISELSPELHDVFLTVFSAGITHKNQNALNVKLLHNEIAAAFQERGFQLGETPIEFADFQKIINDFLK